MERAKDCYYWTHIISTSANVLTYNSKNVWQFGKMACTGALQCKNDRCDYYSRHGLRNASAWMENYKMAVIHKVGEQVQEGGLLCSFCSRRPYCTATGPATMFYMYPKTILPKPSNRELMSRLAVHQGIHIHPERKVFSRKSLEKVKGLLERHHSANPTPTPSRLKNGTIADVIAEFRKESAAGLNKDKEKEIWETLQIVSRRCRRMSIFCSFSSIGFPVRDRRKASLSFLKCLPRELDQEWIS
jgi:hypothetical protein